MFGQCSLRFGDIRGGELVVGEFSLSSLKLKLFLLSDSAPDREEMKCSHHSVLHLTHTKAPISELCQWIKRSACNRCIPPLMTPCSCLYLHSHMFVHTQTHWEFAAQMKSLYTTPSLDFQQQMFLLCFTGPAAATTTCHRNSATKSPLRQFVTGI